MSQAKLPPDPWQGKFIGNIHPRMMLLCARQSGKSTACGALVAQSMIVECPCFVLVLAQNEKMSKEFLATKVRPILVAAGAKILGDNKTSIVLENGSRVIGEAASEKGVRGYSGVNLLMIDEASRIPDELYFACRPMLSTSRGRLIAASTPFGKQGWFFNEWLRGEDQESGIKWHRERVTGDMCPRHTKEFLETERLILGERWYDQEYGCKFTDPIGAVFSEEDIRAAFRRDLAPLRPRPERKTLQPLQGAK